MFCLDNTLSPLLIINRDVLLLFNCSISCLSPTFSDISLSTFDVDDDNNWFSVSMFLDSFYGICKINIRLNAKETIKHKISVCIIKKNL